MGDLLRETADLGPSGRRHRPRKPIGLHSCPYLRHFVPENDDIVRLAVGVSDMVAKQRLGLESEAFEQETVT